MKIIEPEKILSDEKLFKKYMSEITSAYDYLSKTSPFGTDPNYGKFVQNNFLSDRFSSFFKVNKKTKISEYEKLMTEAAEKEFKETMGVDFNTYKSTISKLPDVKKGISGAITELQFGNLKKDPEALEESRRALHEAISQMDFQESSKFSNFISKNKALENMKKMRPESSNQNKNSLTAN